MEKNKHSDYLLFVIVLILIGIGIVMIYSTSAIIAIEKYGDSYYFLKKQLIWFLASLLAVLIMVKVDYHFWYKAALPLLVSSFILLIVVLIPGVSREVGIARRWITIGGFGFQPAEIVKLLMIIYMASSLSDKQRQLDNFISSWFLNFVILGLTCGLIVLEPDFGTAVILAGIVMVMFFVAGLKLSYIASMLLASLPVVYFLIFNVPYRRQRMLAFFDPWQDPKASGFHIIQSFLAFGSGGIFGRGLSESRQKLFYLPEAHTDFIFSIIGEELGFIGCLVLIILFIGFFIRAGKIAFKAKDNIGCFLCLGIIAMIGLEFLVNIGVVIGLLPTKGTPLPFISYGGSSLLVNMAAVGILLNVSKQS